MQEMYFWSIAWHTDSVRRRGEISSYIKQAMIKSKYTYQTDHRTSGRDDTDQGRQILIDGETYQENGEFPGIENAGVAETKVALDSGEYFVLGDNRNNSEDSRYADMGNVKKRNIIGKVWFIASPWSRFGFV